MRRCREVFVGIDTAKARNAAAIAEVGRHRQGGVRYLGEFDNTPDAVAKLVRKLGDRFASITRLAGTPNSSVNRDIAARRKTYGDPHADSI